MNGELDGVAVADERAAGGSGDARRDCRRRSGPRRSGDGQDPGRAEARERPPAAGRGGRGEGAGRDRAARRDRAPGRPRRRSGARWRRRSSPGRRCRRGTTRQWTATRFAPRTSMAASEEAPVRLTVVGESRAGSRPTPRCGRGRRSGSRPARRCPAGADAVVPVEMTTPLDRERRRRAAGAGRDGSAARGVPGPRGREPGQRDPTSRRRRRGRDDRGRGRDRA